MPVLGSGHPQADVFLLKYAPTPAEIEEGVAFYGRAGTALMKSLKRLDIDPLAVYGTLCVKCPVADPRSPRPSASRGWSRRSRSCSRRSSWSWARTRSTTLNDLALPLARDGRATEPGEVQRSRRRSRRSYVPDIDARSTRSPPSARSGARSACSASGARSVERGCARACPSARAG
jgi:hypothetical protein